MNPNDANRDKQKKIQTPTPGGNDHVKTNQGGSETSRVNGDRRLHTRGRNQKNRGNNQQSIQHQSSNFTGSEDSLKILLSPTEIRDKVQSTEFKKLIITHVLENFKHPADIVKLINTVSIPLILLPTYTKFMK